MIRYRKSHSRKDPEAHPRRTANSTKRHVNQSQKLIEINKKPRNSKSTCIHLKIFKDTGPLNSNIESRGNNQILPKKGCLLAKGRAPKVRSASERAETGRLSSVGLLRRWIDMAECPYLHVDVGVWQGKAKQSKAKQEGRAVRERAGERRAYLTSKNESSK